MPKAPNEGDFLGKVSDFAAGPVSRDAPGWSMGAEVDPSLNEEAAKIGILGAMMPSEDGGQGFGFATFIRMSEILAAKDFGFAMSLVNSHNVAGRISNLASKKVRAKYLPRIIKDGEAACTALTEAGAGSDFAAIATRAEKTSSGWRLNGEKAWIVNGRRAGVSVLFAQCGDKPGDSGGIGGFVVDLTVKGVEHFAIDSPLQQTSIGAGGFRLKDVEIPEDHLLMAPGEGFKAALGQINAARTHVSAMCNAMLGEALDQAAAYGRERRAFGKALGEHQAWRLQLAQSETALEASRALTEQAVEDMDKGRDAQRSAALAKVVAVETAQLHLPKLLQIMGAEGLRADYCFSRHVGAAQVAGFTDGATNMLAERVARLSNAGKN